MRIEDYFYFYFVLKKIIIHWFLLLPSISIVYSQKLVFQNLGVNQGLPAMEVYNLFQDRDGYIWVFTEYGIVKHNGSKFVPVCKNLPFRESAVYAVGRSESGELYFANSKARIYKVYKDEAFLVKGLKNYTQAIHQKNQPVLSLFFDKQNSLYFSSFTKTYVIPRNRYWVSGGDKEKRKMTPKISRINPVYPFREYDPESGELFLSLRNRQGKSTHFFHNDSINASRTFSYEFRGNCYFSFMNHLYLYRKNGTTKAYDFGKGVINFKVAPNGHLWVALSSGGLRELDEELNPLEHYLGDVTVSDVLLDNQSGMWVSTIGEGVYYCRNTDHLSFSDIPGLKEQISSLSQIGQYLFIGTASGKLFVRKDHNLREIALKENFACINDVVEYEGKYYVGTKIRTYILNHRFELLETIQPAGYSFVKASDGSLVTINASCIFRKKKGSDSFEAVRLNTWNRCLVEREHGEFFVIMYKGEAIYRLKSTFQCPAYLKKLRGTQVSRIKTDKQKNLWICTKGEGLYRLTRSNKLIHYPHLPSQIVNDVSFLSDYIVLLSTNKGAFVCRLNQLQSKSAWLKLHDEEVLRMIATDEEVMIGTTSGLTSLNIHKLFQTIHYRFLLASVENENKKLPMERLSQLHYTQNDLYFNYDFLAYGDPSKQLVYKLEGPSSLYGKADGTQVHLQNLSPGKYTLTVFPQINLIHGNDQKIVSTFYIRAAFWQTSWFLVVVILSALLITVLCSWGIMRSRRKKEIQRTHIEKLLAEYRLTALKAQVNPHFMSNSLVAIQELIMKKETSKANQYLAKFSMLIRYLLDYSDQQVTSIHNELKVIDLYVALEQLRFDDRFRFIKEIDEDVRPDQLFIPSLITQPLLENAIWHGLLPLSDDRIPTLTLSIKLDRNNLCISISDNGVGRPAPSDLPVKARAFKESKGTKLIAKRIENLNKLYAPANGWIEFIDHADEDGNPTGTTVQLFFSLNLINRLYHDKNQKSYY